MVLVPFQKVDDLFAEYDKPDSPGCALAIIQNGEVIYKKGYGSANLEYHIPIIPTTVFHVASVSKQFTAMAIMLLVQANLLDLDDDVRKYVPELPDFGAKITIRHLLHHTSGLRDQWELLTLAGWRMDDVITTQDVIELLKRQENLNFDPGSDYLYCNSGYTLLGLIVEQNSGKTLRRFCQENLFEPLGMMDTHFHDDHTEIVINRAYSYEPQEGGGFKHSVLSYSTIGASSLFTTVEDLACWDANFYTTIVGSKTIIDQMQTPGLLNDGKKLSYAFGLTVGSYHGLKVVEHSGGDAGYRSHLIRFPEEHFSVAILSNLSTTNPGAVTRRIADLYLEDVILAKGVSLDHLEMFAPSGLTQADLEQISGVYYNKIRNESQRLELREGKLFLAEGKGFEMLPKSRDRFSLVGYPEYEIRFKHLDDGKSDEMDMSSGTTPAVSYRRVTPPSLPDTAQKKYHGVYYSLELDTTYYVESQNGKLGIRRRKYGFTPLLPTIPDGFAGGNGDILFIRAPNHSVIGFSITTGRVWNLIFKRLGRIAPRGKPVEHRGKSKVRKEVSE